MGLPWFSTKGQIVQTVCAVFGATILGINQWSTIKESEYFSREAVAFYAFCIVAVLSVLKLRPHVAGEPLKAALWLLTAAGLGALAWAYFVAPDRDSIRIIGYSAGPLAVGKKVVMNLGIFSPDPVKVVGISTVRYVDRVPDSAYERRGLEEGIWQDFISKGPGAGVALSFPGGQAITIPQRSELPASEYVVQVYLMGHFRSPGRSRERHYCVYALYNPPRIGVCVEHND